MLAVIQRVTGANVSVNQNIIGQIQKGIVALIGIEKTDTEKNANRLLEKILTYRIFNDSAGKMNLSVKDINGGLLLVSQFTIVADTQSGTRPGFSVAMAPAESKILFDYTIQKAEQAYANIAAGEFGADMQISLCNDGPVTFILKS
jgi:D-tyrosyl-tRNA(Tyr) deacylase